MCSITKEIDHGVDLAVDVRLILKWFLYRHLIHNNIFIFKNIKLLQISNLIGSILREYINWCLIKQ
jgi:hypothetical protein